MDEPNLPDGPTFPKRGVFVGAGLAAGLILGIMLVAWREYRDTAMRNERDVWAFTKLPTLAVISFTGDVEEIKPRWRFFGRSRPEFPASAKPLTNTGR
jgi:capsular polysaccharide biosynthesis protein